MWLRVSACEIRGRAKPHVTGAEATPEHKELRPPKGPTECAHERTSNR